MGMPSRDWRRLLGELQANAPSFLWAPWDVDSAFRDLARSAAPTGTRLTVDAGGVWPRAGNDADFLKFNSTLPSLSTYNSGFVGCAVVSITAPSAVTGAFLKIGGGGANGLGFGGGSTNFEDSGSRGIMLRENVAWHTSATGFWASGVNILTFGVTSGTIMVLTNHTTGSEVAMSVPGSNAYADTTISIAGCLTARGFCGGVHALAIYEKALPESSPFTYQDFRDNLSRILRPLQGMQAHEVSAYSRARRSRAVGVAPAGMAAALTGASTLTASLSTAIRLTSSPAATSALSASLSTAILLTAAPAGVSTLNASLTTGSTLASSLAAASTLSASLTTDIRLTASPAATSTLSASLTTNIRLTAAPVAVSTLSAGLTTAITLTATSAAQSTLTGSLTTSPAGVSASLAATSTLSASLTTAIKLAASPVAVCTLTADLTAGSLLSASAATTCSLTASLTTAIRLTAAPSAQVTASAALTTAIRATATLINQVSLSASLSGTGTHLSALLEASATVQAVLSTYTLNGIVTTMYVAPEGNAMSISPEGNFMYVEAD